MNPRIATIDPTTATGPLAAKFAAVKAKLGLVPNLVRTFAQAPAVLDAYLGLSGSLAAGVLPAKVREQLALTLGEANGCDYCLSAHSLGGKAAGLSPADVEAARRGTAADPKADALLRFASAVLNQRGAVSDETVATVRAAGATDAEILEVVAHVALNVLTNFTNNVVQTTIDFPHAKPLAEAAA